MIELAERVGIFIIIALVWVISLMMASAMDYDLLFTFILILPPLYLAYGFFNILYKLIHHRDPPWVRARKEKIKVKREKDVEEARWHEVQQRSVFNGRRQNTIDFIHRHKLGLKTQYLKLVTKDVYGVMNFDKWFAERDHFIDNVIYDTYKPEACGFSRAELEETVTNLAIDFAHEHAGIQDVTDLSGVEYEQHCARILEMNGWTAKTTPGSGDQGVDVIANKGPTTVAIQCKKYSKPVGNAAVQEIVAGMRFFRAQYGAVVTNAGYTPQAQSLAQANGILLLHHSDLPNLGAILSGA